MRKKNLIWFLMLLILPACKSETQQRALDEVASIYDAKTGYSKGFTKNAGEPKITYFKIKVSESSIIEETDVQSAASNIALVVYKNLTDKEKESISHISVLITGSDGKETDRIFAIPELEKPAVQAGIFEAFSKAVMEGDYAAIPEMVDPKYRKQEVAASIGGYMKGKIEENGKLAAYKRITFNLRMYEDMPQKFRFTGLFIFENKSTLAYEVETDSETGNPYIFKFHIN